MKGKKKLSSTAPVPLEGLDDFVMAMIEALKGAEDPYAVAEVENLMITPELEELMRFVGIAKIVQITYIFINVNFVMNV